MNNLIGTYNYGEKLRFNWNSPIHLSPHEKGTLYLGSQFLFRTRDHGATWDRISPDLTTNDPSRQKQEASGGITVDNSSAEMHTTIYSISESPKAPGLIWTGTDDGNLQVTRDSGGHWENLTSRLPGVPKGSWISWVEAGPHDAKVAYVTVDRHTFGDFTPRAFRTTDGGTTWASILPAGAGVRGWAHVIKEDPLRPGLLYLGTEYGLWISVDHGAQWAEFKAGHFPAVAVRDLAFQIRDGSLVIATHGRGIWILDDLAPLRALDASTLQAEVAFVGLQPVQQRLEGNGGWPEGDGSYRGENPTSGAVITYYQRSRHLFGELKLEVLDAQGRLVESLPTSKRRGLNRVVWPMREKAPIVPPAAQISGAATSGPRVLTGTYTLRLTKNGKSTEAKLEVGLDRRATYTLADRQAQHAATMRVHGLFGRMSALAARIVAARDGAGAASAKLQATEPLKAQLLAASGEADALRKRIVATTEGGAITGEERLREHMDLLYGALAFYEGAPAATLLARTEVLQRELVEIEEAFEAFLVGPFAKSNDALKAKGWPAIQVPLNGAPASTAAGSAQAPSLWKSRMGHGQSS